MPFSAWFVSPGNSVPTHIVGSRSIGPLLAERASAPQLGTATRTALLSVSLSEISHSIPAATCGVQ
jgi:hypothetical protein